ncbi:unnamed protein product, partial [Meganyctiphanes norvegica]
SLPSPWGWSCVEGKCVREEQDGIKNLMGLNKCKLTCGEFGPLWPKPTVLTTISKETLVFLLPQLVLHKLTTPADESDDLTRKAFDIFLNNVAAKFPGGEGKPDQGRAHAPEVLNQRVEVEVTVSSAAARLTLETSEKYTLGITTTESVTHVTILAVNFFGARHALETLSQLIEYEEYADALQIVNTAAVVDSPAFSYRGILLDTSRNFFSVKSIERTLDAMAANKLNTFHWHITDSHSFPLYLESLPQMVYYGAYTPRQIYYPKDIRNLVEYGRVRGIRVLPEFDAPAHVGNGWQWGEKEGMGKLAVCVNQEPWQSFCVEPPCGQLNIVNDRVYDVLGQIYKEMADLFGPLDMFHYGGDEVNLNCWNTTEEIVTYMDKVGKGQRTEEDFYDLWSQFQSRAYGLMTIANKGKHIPGILWTSHLTEKGHTAKYLDKNQYIIQIWSTGTDPLIKELLEGGFSVIFSNYDAWYLDCGYGAWVGEGNNWCSPYKGWQTVYDNSPTAMAKNLTGKAHDASILGGEAALWSEQVDETSLDSKLWPRGQALAERLWTNPEHNWESAELRMVHQRQRLVQRGIEADRLQPQWCHQNEGLCYL